jgi:hypothetical protein
MAQFSGVPPVPLPNQPFVRFNDTDDPKEQQLLVASIREALSRNQMVVVGKFKPPRVIGEFNVENITEWVGSADQSVQWQGGTILSQF